jgi:hypothetical protein
MLMTDRRTASYCCEKTIAAKCLLKVYLWNVCNHLSIRKNVGDIPADYPCPLAALSLAEIIILPGNNLQKMHLVLTLIFQL